MEKSRHQGCTQQAMLPRRTGYSANNKVAQVSKLNLFSACRVYYGGIFTSTCSGVCTAQKYQNLVATFVQIAINTGGYSDN